MKKLFNLPYFKPAIFAILFVFASLCVYFSGTIIASIVVHTGRFLLEFFPTLLTLWMPLMSLCFLWMYWNVKDASSKWKIIKWYGIILTIVEAVALAMHIVMISTEFGWDLSRNVTTLFPFDIMALAIVMLAIGVYSIIWACKNKSYGQIEKTSGYVIKTRTFVAVWVMLCFSAYFFGGFLHSFNLLDHIDPDWWAMIPVILSLCLMTFETVMFILYKQGPEENKKANHLKYLIITGAAFVVIFGWIGIALLITPYYIQNSCSSLYLLGFSIKIPFGLFFSMIGVIAPCIVSLVRYIKRYVKK